MTDVLPVAVLLVAVLAGVAALVVLARSLRDRVARLSEDVRTLLERLRTTVADRLVALHSVQSEQSRQAVDSTHREVADLREGVTRLTDEALTHRYLATVYPEAAVTLPGFVDSRVDEVLLRAYLDVVEELDLEVLFSQEQARGPRYWLGVRPTAGAFSEAATKALDAVLRLREPLRADTPDPAGRLAAHLDAAGGGSLQLGYLAMVSQGVGTTVVACDIDDLRLLARTAHLGRDTVRDTLAGITARHAATSPARVSTVATARRSSLIADLPRNVTGISQDSPSPSFMASEPRAPRGPSL